MGLGVGSQVQGSDGHWAVVVETVVHGSHVVVGILGHAVVVVVGEPVVLHSHGSGDGHVIGDFVVGHSVGGAPVVGHEHSVGVVTVGHSLGVVVVGHSQGCVEGHSVGACDAVFYRTYPHLYHKFGSLLIFGAETYIH